MKNEIVFCAPIFNYPAIGGPELRVLNTIKALAHNHSVNLVTWENSSKVSKFNELEIIKILNIRSIERLHLQEFSVSENHSNKNSKLNVFFKLLNSFVNRERHKREKFIAKEIVKLCHNLEISKIWFSYSNISISIFKKIRLLDKNLYLVADTDSVWSRFILRAVPYLPIHMKIRECISGLRKILQEIQLVKLATILVAVSEIDQLYYRKFTSDRAKIKLAYNVIEPARYSLSLKKDLISNELNLLLAGTFGHKYSPMDQGAKWFIEEVWPDVRRHFSNAKLYFVGRGSKILWKSNPEIGLFVEGEVQSIQNYLDIADISVVPLFFESGTRFKILEAVACNVPVVSTTLGAEGLHFINNREIMIADSSFDFLQSILKLQNQYFRSEILNYARKKLESEYTLDTLVLQVDEII